MTRDEYIVMYATYRKMNTKSLRKVVKELYHRKFIDHDIEAYTPHRIAARALLERERTGESLVYHMKDFLR